MARVFDGSRAPCEPHLLAYRQLSALPIDAIATGGVASLGCATVTPAMQHAALASPRLEEKSVPDPMDALWFSWAGSQASVYRFCVVSSFGVCDCSDGR